MPTGGIDANERLGVIAGDGDLPGQLIDSCQKLGRDVFVIAINGAADPNTVQDVAHVWLDLGAVGRAKKALRDAGCREVCFAGGIDRPSLGNLKPDLQGMKLLPRVIAASRAGDDAILTVVVEFFEEAGFKIVGAETIMSPLQTPVGALGQHHPDREDDADIEKAIRVIEALGPHDVGQAAVVRGGQVLAIEAAEGTDAMLARCAGFSCDTPRGVLVKCPKPGQERRIDLPAIGPRTVAGAAAAGLKGIAIAAGGSLIVERDTTVRQADENGLFIVGVPATLPD